MIKVEFLCDEYPDGIRAQFARVNRFYLASDGSAEDDTPVSKEGSQTELAALFAEQADRMGWPITFPEPTLDTQTREELWPVIAFDIHSRDGFVFYTLRGWEPAPEAIESREAENPEALTEPEPTGMADNPEVITPAKGSKARKS